MSTPTDPPIVVRTTVPDPSNNPDVSKVDSVVLRDSKKVRKEAAYLVVTDRHTGEYHHEALTITTTRKLKAGDVEDPKRSIGLSNQDGEDEIQKLIEFLQVVRSGSIPKVPAKYVVLPTGNGSLAHQLAEVVRTASADGKADLLADVLTKATKDRTVFEAILARAATDPELFAHAAAAIKLGAYRQAVRELELLVNSSGVREQKFQDLLKQHPWMFGSEYSELLDRRKWTRDENQDFVVRRSTDGYIEVIEIKTTLEGSPLFGYDKSHQSTYAGAELSKVVGQVEKYLESLDADRLRIQATDKEDTNKIRAKVIIGRNINDAHVAALRRFNGHLVRIEVITFDQLLNIARRVLSYLEGVVESDPPGAVTSMPQACEEIPS
jgi:hypothetical protein